ncbi:MAG: hypothetical protein PF489_03985, partial [Salinivirgaceae bacterium]|nr:hypothetical protein [Salinivirgaceae bacterium]
MDKIHFYILIGLIGISGQPFLVLLVFVFKIVVLMLVVMFFRLFASAVQSFFGMFGWVGECKLSNKFFRYFPLCTNSHPELLLP